MNGERKTYAEGLLYALAAYGWWGIVPPVYFRVLSHVGPLEILAQRIVWSVPVLAVLLCATGQLPELRRCLGDRRLVGLLLLTTLLVSVNWLVYIYGVTSAQIVQTSLGYFINPLVNVLLGVVFFRERLRGPQWVAVALATAGVVLMTAASAEVPWIALTLALSFGLYGMFRKKAPADGAVSLTVEVLLLVPVSAGYVLYVTAAGQSGFLTHGIGTDVLLMFGGLVTVIPLVCFGQAARKLPLSTLGFVQYLSPTAQLLIAVLVFREEMTLVKLGSFALIWAGLAVVSVDSVLAYRQRRSALVPEAECLVE